MRELLPLLVAAFLTIGLVPPALSLFRHRQHPGRILKHALGAASIVAILSLAGLVPEAAWWAPWLVTLVLVAGVAVACRRLLASEPPAEPTAREAARLRSPGALGLGAEVTGYLALLVIALAAG